jgi:tetratricopeptide (TPR) repeat protein
MNPITIIKRHKDILACVALAFVTILVYFRVYTFEFINFDDDAYVSANEHVVGGATLENLEWAFYLQKKENFNWHPLTWISHMIDCDLFGLKPGYHHLMNLLFHVLNSILVFFVFRVSTKAFWKSLFIAFLFALHPVQVGTVAWVAERKNLLCTFWGLLSVLFWIFYTQRPKVILYVAVSVCLALSLMAKPMLVTLPFVFVLFDIWPTERVRFKTQSNSGRPRAFTWYLVEKLPFFLIIFVFMLLFIEAVPFVTTETHPWNLRIINAIISYTAYIQMAFWPANLVILYPFPTEVPPLWHIVLSSLFIVTISVLSIAFIKRARFVFVCWFFFLGTLVPATGLVQSGVWPAMADRFFYLPIIGIFTVAVFGASALWQKIKLSRQGIFAIGILIITVLAGATWLQLGHWKNSVTVFERAAQFTKDNYLIHENLGLAYAKQGNLKKAIENFSETLKIDPHNSDSLYNLGFSLVLAGNIDAGIFFLQKAVQSDPQDLKAHLNLGTALAKAGRMDQAIPHFQRVIEINPRSVEAHFNIAKALSNQNQRDQAIEHYSTVIQLAPKLAEARTLLGMELFLKGDRDLGKSHVMEALRIDGENREARRALQFIEKNTQPNNTPTP